EANYVANVGVWWNAADLLGLNSIQPKDLVSLYGLDITRAADRTLLSSPLLSSVARNAGFGAPYAGYPMGATVAQTLRPYPQFESLTNNHWVPVGNPWYNSLHSKVTKRLSHGLDLSGSFTWQKSLVICVEDKFGRGGGVFVNDPFNRRNQKTYS